MAKKDTLGIGLETSRIEVLESFVDFVADEGFPVDFSDKCDACANQMPAVRDEDAFARTCFGCRYCRRKGHGRKNNYVEEESI